MNIELLTQVALWLEADVPPKAGITTFDMTDFIQHDIDNPCGTACCIAGAAVQFKRLMDGQAPMTLNEAGRFAWHSEARYELQLDDIQTDQLFYGATDIPLHAITPAWAARCIRNLIATGNVDWEGTKEPTC